MHVAQTVRRLAVSSLTSAAHNKPHLVRDHMATLQPLLYEQTKPDPKLVHEVVMGPFKVKVDDGLNIRKVGQVCLLRKNASAKALAIGCIPVHVYASRNLLEQAGHQYLSRPGHRWTK
jgi:hypothetical protein